MKLEKKTTFSKCRKYRYILWRQLDDLFITKSAYIMFIGLNPSTADNVNDDPTIRRCIGYAKYWGYINLCITNLFAFRATSPEDMFNAKDPIGPENNFVLAEMAKNAEIIIAAWGVHGGFLKRDKEVREMIPVLHYLRLSKNGFPCHPLYLPKNLIPVLWE